MSFVLLLSVNALGLLIGSAALLVCLVSSHSSTLSLLLFSSSSSFFSSSSSTLSRSQEEMDVGMIPNAITRAAFEADPSKYESKEVVCYCTVGYISGACTYELRKKGHTNVKNMGDGALLGYTLAKTAAGVSKPLVKPGDGTSTNEVHCFMPPLAALAGEGMVGKSFADPPAVLEAANASIKERTGL